MDYQEKIIKSKYLYQGRIVNLRIDQVELANNKQAEREVIEHSGGVCALAKTADNKIFFVRQYRIPYQENLLELPAGKIDEEESPEDAILRELKEEVGVVPKSIQKIGIMYPSPGYTNEVIHLYYTDDFLMVSNDLDEDEFLEVVLIDADKVDQLIDQEKIVDAKSLILLLRLARKLSNRELTSKPSKK